MHCKNFFVSKTPDASSGPERDKKKALQKHHIVQNGTFCFITFHLSDFSETLPKCGDNCYGHKSSTASPAKQWFMFPGTFRAKNALIGGFSGVCPKYAKNVQWILLC